MRLLPALPILLATSIAHAQPCDVEIVRAPDDVGTEIAAWMRSETQCRRALRVRVVETTGGLYVTAQEPSGRLHERVVPDGQTAAVLVASWAADDGAAPPPPAAPIVVASAPATPANTPLVVVAASPPPRPQYLIDVGGMYSLVEDGTSLRIGIDAQRVGPVMLGVVAARETTAWVTDNGPSLRTTAVELLARGAIERTWGSLGVRAELAAGFERISDDTMSSSTVVAGVVEGSLTTGVWFTHNWRFRGGPLLSTVPAVSFPSNVLRGGLDLRLWVGFDRRL